MRLARRIRTANLSPIPRQRPDMRPPVRNQANGRKTAQLAASPRREGLICDVLNMHLPALPTDGLLRPFQPLATSSTLGLTVGGRTDPMRARLRGLPRDDAELDPGRFRLSRLVAVAGLERRERDLRPRRPIPAQSTAIVVSRGWQQRATSKSPKPAFATRPGTSTPRRWRSASRPNVNHASRRRPDFDQDSGMPPRPASSPRKSGSRFDRRCGPPALKGAIRR